MISWPSANAPLQPDEGTLFAFLAWKYSCVANTPMSSARRQECFGPISRFMNHQYRSNQYTVDALSNYINLVRTSKKHFYRSSKKRYHVFRREIDLILAQHVRAFERLIDPTPPPSPLPIPPPHSSAQLTTCTSIQGTNITTRA